MDIADAFQIVIDLAKQNALDTDRLRPVDGEEIYAEALRQQEAIDMVEDYVVNELGDD